MKYKYLVLIIPILIFFVFFFKPEEEPVLNEEESILNLEKEEVVETIKVEIKGAVLNPGVYELDKDSRVLDVINKSGGLIDNSDTSTINLSKLLKDEMVVIIYTEEEILEMREGSTSVKYIENVCVCPQIKNDACLSDIVTNIETNDKNGKISLNSATLEELMTLSGIGKSKAEAIISYRESNGGFKSIEELTNVKGIGNSVYEKIKDFITI